MGLQLASACKTLNIWSFIYLDIPREQGELPSLLHRSLALTQWSLSYEGVAQVRACFIRLIALSRAFYLFSLFASFSSKGSALPPLLFWLPFVPGIAAHWSGIASRLLISFPGALHEYQGHKNLQLGRGIKGGSLCVVLFGIVLALLC